MNKYDDIDFINIVRESISISQVLKKIGLKPAGGNYQTVKRRIKCLEIDISHFKGQGYLKGENHNWAKKISLDKILIKDSIYGGGSHLLKKRLFKEKIFEKKCYRCGLTNWLGNELSLELEHINGDHFDNRIENLTILCPNCHSLTPTYRGKKKKIYKILYSKCKIKKENFCIKCNNKISKYSKSGLCRKCAIKRKVENRPTKEQLLKEILESNYSAVGRKYGVSRTCIRRWLI